MSKILVYNIGLFLDSVWFGMLHQITLKAIVRNLYTLGKKENWKQRKSSYMLERLWEQLTSPQHTVSLSNPQSSAGKGLIHKDRLK